MDRDGPRESVMDLESTQCMHLNQVFVRVVYTLEGTHS